METLKGVTFFSKVKHLPAVNSGLKTKLPLSFHYAAPKSPLKAWISWRKLRAGIQAGCY